MHVLKTATLWAALCLGLGAASAADPIVESQACKERANSLADPGKAVKYGMPRYPLEAATQKHVPSGYVLLSFRLDEHGYTHDINVLCEIPQHRGFGESAKQAIAETIYQSGRPGEYGRVTRFRFE